MTMLDHPALNLMRAAKRMLKTQPDHIKILHCFAEAQDESGDFCYLAFNTVSSRTKITWSKARRITRHLARSDYLKYGKGLWSMDGTPAGSGYAITTMGHALSELIKDKEAENVNGTV